jgi:hypothetical protein
MQHQTLVKFNAKMHISKRQNIILFIPQASQSSWLNATADIQRGARIKIKIAEDTENSLAIAMSNESSKKTKQNHLIVFVLHEKTHDATTIPPIQWNCKYI